MNKKLVGMLVTVMVFIKSVNVFAQETHTIENTQKKKEVILQLDNTLARVDGENYTLATPPKVIEGRTYLPLRFMADQLLESDVYWDAVAKRVTITKGDKKVQVKIDSKEAFINGTKVGLSNSPMIDEGTTYLPLRTMAELFEIQTEYDQVARQITLLKVEEMNIIPPDINKAPIAQFSFEEEKYTEGQSIKVIDESFDEDGDSLTNRLWMVNFNEKQANSKLENLISKPKAGLYKVSLKVKDSKGTWSEWVTKEINIVPNQKPVVTTLVTDKESYAGGEGIEFTYTYENESWEGIKAERWTYRREDEPLNKAVADKPKFIFHEGKYVVTLQLQDDNNNWSDPKEVIVDVNEEAQQTELEYRFLKGQIGDIIDNFQDFNHRDYKDITPDETILMDGTLIMSDSPEDVKHKGILYRDTASGVGRILFHHNNAFTEKDNQMERKRLVLIAENTSNKPVNFVISDRIIKGPSTDALYIGQQLLFSYLKGNGENRYSLNPGEKTYIYDSANRKWDTGQLISGKMDFNIDGQITFTVAAIGRDTKIDDVAEFPLLNKDVHPRGTFDKIEIYHKIELKDTEPARILLGTGPEEWVDGYDAITGEIVQNRGNYGVTYTLEITAKEDTGVMLNPRAGVFRGAIRWDGNKTYLAPSKGYFTGHNSKAVMLGVIKAGETRKLEYVLPNGSASPVLLGFIPKSHWDQ